MMPEEKEQICTHNWIPLLGRVGKKDVPTALYTCLNCGDLKVGTHTIRISKSRLDMGGHPMKSVSTVDYNAAPAAGAATGFMTTLTAGSSVNVGDACKITPATGRAVLAKADAIANASTIVMAAATIASASAGLFLVSGIARMSSSPSWTVGSLIYLSTTGTTGNTLTQTAPTATNNVIQILGVALTADTLYFSPQLVQIEHA
jgi:hypothetical protein